VTLLSSAQVVPLVRFGVELTGVDLTRPLTPEEQHRLNELFDAHRLLLFRRQALDVDDHIRLLSYLGPVKEQQHGRIPSYVSNVRADATPALQAGPLLFHSDYAFTATPLAALSLYAEEVAPGSTTTHFADAVGAASDLDERTKAAIEGRSARHVYDPADVAGHNADALRRGALTPPPDAESATHPVLLRHGRTGADVLYVGQAQTVAIEGVERDVSIAMLGSLFNVLYAPDNCYEHHWEPGDLLVWDNVGLQHARGSVGRGAPRTLCRIVIGGGWMSGDGPGGAARSGSDAY
jgi:taurine dioxygenase